MSLKHVLDYMVDVLRLTNWDIQLLIDDCLNNYGETFFINNDNKCTIKIKSDLTDTEKVKTLIHELVHIVKRNSQTIAIDNIKNEDIREIWLREMEKEQQYLSNAYYELLKNKFDI